MICTYIVSIHILSCSDVDAYYIWNKKSVFIEYQKNQFIYGYMRVFTMVLPNTPQYTRYKTSFSKNKLYVPLTEWTETILGLVWIQKFLNINVRFLFEHKWSVNRSYECTEPTFYFADISRGSEKRGVIELGEIIVLEEIHNNTDEQRIRGRTSKGWVSLENTENGHIYFVSNLFFSKTAQIESKNVLWIWTPHAVIDWTLLCGETKFCFDFSTPRMHFFSARRRWMMVDLGNFRKLRSKDSFRTTWRIRFHFPFVACVLQVNCFVACVVHAKSFLKRSWTSFHRGIFEM